MEFNHVSVLLNETVDSLNIKPDGIYVDGTLGGGGHSYEIAKRLSGTGRLIGIDRDSDAIMAASERLKEFEDKVTIVRTNYGNLVLKHFKSLTCCHKGIRVSVNPDKTPLVRKSLSNLI